jgi:tetratricopeptide (TPR) repeat protein
LRKAQPDAARTAELQAAVLDAEGKPSEAAAAVIKFAGDDPAKAGVAAAVLDRLGLGEWAEPLVRKLAADPKRPQAALALAAFLGRQGRTKDALGVLRDRGAKLPPAAVAQVGVEVLYNAPAVDPADVRTVEGLLAAAKAAGTKPAALLTLTGVLRMAEGKYPEAVAAYREVVGQGGPPDPVALNNLGYLLAVHAGRPDEGLELVRQAKQLAGPQGWILDTEAVVLTRKGEAAQAVELLSQVARDTAEPAALVHLAQAYRAAGNTAAADEVARQARRQKVRAIDLPPPERAGLRQVLAGGRG